MEGDPGGVGGVGGVGQKCASWQWSPFDIRIFENSDPKSTQRLILIDEGGNFDFSTKGTSYFIMTAVSKSFSYSEHAELAELKYDLLSEQRLFLAGFHASEDRQVVRNQVFRIIQEHLHHHRIYAVIYEKGTLPEELKRSTNLYTHAIDFRSPNRGLLQLGDLSEMGKRRRQIL